jgi:GR25 family glycosyltransferase involved in LPS biosynthesis
MVNNIDKIYVLNHSDFINRRRFIENRLYSQNIDFELVQTYHPNEIDYDKEMAGWEKFEDIDILCTTSKYRNFSQKLNVGSLSLNLKHIWCYKNQIENNYENVLILEDDADIPDNFKQYIEDNMEEFLKLKEEIGVGMMMLGNCFDFLTANKHERFNHTFYNVNQKTRCTHAYVINLDTTKKILSRFKNHNLPIDFKLAEIIQIEDIKVSWSEPSIWQKLNI